MKDFAEVTAENIGVQMKEDTERARREKAEQLAGEINLIKDQTSALLAAAETQAKISCFEIGKRLVVAKGLVPYGEWGGWLSENVAYSERTAGNLMRIYNEYGDDQIDMFSGKSDADTFGGLNQSQLVELFALPKGQRAGFVEEHREELESGKMSVRELKKQIAEQKKKIEEQETAIRENDESFARMVKEMDAAMEQASNAEAERQKAEAEADKEKDELIKSHRDELNKLRKQNDERVAEIEKQLQKNRVQGDTIWERCVLRFDDIRYQIARIGQEIEKEPDEQKRTRMLEKCAALMTRMTDAAGWC